MAAFATDVQRRDEVHDKPARTVYQIGTEHNAIVNPAPGQLHAPRTAALVREFAAFPVVGGCYARMLVS